MATMDSTKTYSHCWVLRDVQLMPRYHAKLFVVVGGIMQNRKGSIELFCKNRSNNLVREGHFGEGYLLVGAGIDLWGEAIRATNDKDEAADTAIHTFLKPLSILNGAKLGALLIEQDNAVGVVDKAEDSLALGGFLLRFGEVFGVADVGKICDVKLVIEVDAFSVHIHKSSNLLHIGLADNYKFYIHNSISNAFLTMWCIS